MFPATAFGADGGGRSHAKAAGRGCCPTTRCPGRPAARTPRRAQADYYAASAASSASSLASAASSVAYSASSTAAIAKSMASAA